MERAVKARTARRWCYCWEAAQRSVSGENSAPSPPFCTLDTFHRVNIQLILDNLV